VVIVALAIIQAFARRHAMSPDGMSYLDLSDAVVTGRWAELVNLYWSPLYPALIGLTRLVLRPSAYWEFATVHLVTLLSFVVTFAAFEYFLSTLRTSARAWRRSPLASGWGVAASYVVFGAFALTMTPMELTTPDLLVAAASLCAFGILLRAPWRDAAANRLGLGLGVFLGLGALAKSFLVPWSLVCLAVFALAIRRRGWRPLVWAVAAWCVIVVPWTAILSHRAGRLTFGDAGRLTFAWYVNGQEVPSLGGVPPETRTPGVQAILPGAGVTGDAPGTDPMWYDPVRWNASVRPHWSFTDQRETVEALVRYYIQNLTPLFFALLLIAVAEPAERREAWRRGWVVFVPVLAGLAAYASVIVTTRYIMSFLLAGALVLVAALPWPRRVLPHRLLLGAGLALGLETLAPRSSVPLALMAAVLAGLLVASLVPMRPYARWVFATILGLVIARVLLPATLPTVVRAGAVIVVLALWWRARAVVSARRPVQFSMRVGTGLATLLVVVIVFRLGIRLVDDFSVALSAPERRLGRPANLSWDIARDLDRRGIGPGSRIALVGPADQAYWARAGRLHIVADVPGPRVQAFWALSLEAQDALLAQFAAAGAQWIVASVPPSGGAPEEWMPTTYHGLIRRVAR